MFLHSYWRLYNSTSLETHQWCVLYCNSYRQSLLFVCSLSKYIIYICISIWYISDLSFQGIQAVTSPLFLHWFVCSCLWTAANGNRVATLPRPMTLTPTPTLTHTYTHAYSVCFVMATGNPVWVWQTMPMLSELLDFNFDLIVGVCATKPSLSYCPA